MGSNPFLLLLGSMFITVLDVLVLLGLFPFGLEVSVVMGKPAASTDEVDRWFKETNINLSYTECISTCTSTSQGMTDLDTIEHVGFLLYFLSKFKCPKDIQGIYPSRLSLSCRKLEGSYGSLYGWPSGQEVRPFSGYGYL